MLVLTRMAHTDPEKLPSWSESTDAEIVNALQAHYDPDDPTDLTKIWSVGDERIVHLNAIPATGVGEAHDEQDVSMVIMNIGGKELVTPINGHTECAFIIGLKSNLALGPYAASPNHRKGTGYMNPSDSISGGWKDSARRTWCNTTFKNAIASSKIQGIFKEFKNISSTFAIPSKVSTGVETYDYFALPSEKEFIGSNTYSSSSAESSLSQFEWYEDSANRALVGKLDDSGNVYGWLRSMWHDSDYSPSYGEYYDFVCCSQGQVAYYSEDAWYALPIFGVI